MAEEVCSGRVSSWFFHFLKGEDRRRHRHDDEQDHQDRGDDLSIPQELRQLCTSSNWPLQYLGKGIFLPLHLVGHTGVRRIERAVAVHTERPVVAAAPCLGHHPGEHIVVFHPFLAAGAGPLVGEADLAGRDAMYSSMPLSGIRLFHSATVAEKGQVSFSNP